MRRPLLYYCVALIFGCFCDLLYFKGFYIGAAFMAAFFLITIFTTVEYNKFTYIIFSFFILGILTYAIYFQLTDYIGERVSIRIKAINYIGIIGEHKGKLLQLKGDISKIQEGDLLIAKGVLIKSPIYDKGIVGIYEVHSIIEKKEDFLSSIYEFKKNIYSKLEKNLGSKRAAIVSAAAFGDTSHIQKEDKEVFNRLGILHVVSVSGLHLAIIYKLLEKAGGISLALPISYIYTIFTGGAAATFRAFIMILILKLSSKFYRKYDSLSSLALSAILLILYRPYYITDIGFTLSYLSMLGIFLTYKSLQGKLYFLPKKLNEAVSLSVSAQFLSAPFVIAVMNNFSSGFILGNLFLLPIYTAVVVVGNTALLLAGSTILFKVCCFILKIITITLEGGSLILYNICPPVFVMEYSYSIYIIIIYVSYIMFKHDKKKFIYLPLIIIPLIIVNYYSFFPKFLYNNR